MQQRPVVQPVARALLGQAAHAPRERVRIAALTAERLHAPAALHRARAQRHQLPAPAAPRWAARGM